MKSNLPVVIDPQLIEYLPSVRRQSSASSIEQEAILVAEDPRLLENLGKDILSTGLKGLVVYLTDGISLIRYYGTLVSVCRDIRGGDFKSVGKRTMTRTFFAPKRREVQRLAEMGHDDEALSLLNELLVELEEIDDYEQRSALNIQRAQLHHRNGRFHLAAIYFMESATLTSTQKSHIVESEGEKYYINKCARLYLASLQNLALHLELNVIDDNFQHWIGDLARRASVFFEKEARYREMDKWHIRKSGEIRCGKFAIPLPGLHKDIVSPEYNRKLALEVKKITAKLDKKALVANIQAYLKEKTYLQDDVEMLLEVAREIDKQSDELEYEKVATFYDFLEKTIRESSEYSACAPDIELLKVQCKIRFGRASSNDLMRIFKLLDDCKDQEDVFTRLLITADRLSTLFGQEERREFARLVLEKNYPHLKEENKLCYSKIAGMLEHCPNPVLNCFYPESLEVFKANIKQLQVQDHQYLYRGSLKTATHAEMLSLLIHRNKARFPDGDHSDFAHKLSHQSQELPEFEITDLTTLLNMVCARLPLEEKLSYLKGRLKHQGTRIGIFGLTKVGKSTFLNALLRRELLKSDRDVATNCITIIRSGFRDAAVVHFEGCKQQEVSLSEVGKFTSEQGNQQNKLKVSHVEVTLVSHLPEGVELLDIPGFGAHDADFELHRSVIDNALNLVDAAFMVTTPADGLKAFELDFIKRVTADKKLPFVLIGNKIDEVEEEEREDLKFGFRERLQKNDIPLNDLPVFFVSGQLGLASIDGIELRRLMGRSVPEAIEESAMTLVNASLLEIVSKVSLQKRRSIIELIKMEVSHLKDSGLQKLREWNYAQETSVEEITSRIAEIEALNARMKSEFDEHFEFCESQISKLIGLTEDEFIDKGSSRAIGLNCENVREFYELFEEVSHSVVSVLNDARLSFSSMLEATAESAKKLNLNISIAYHQQRSEIMLEPTNPKKMLITIIKNMITPEFIKLMSLKGKLRKKFEYFKSYAVQQRSEELRYQQRLLSQIRAQIEEQVSILQESRNFSNSDYEERKAFMQQQVNNCDRVLKELEGIHG